MQYRFTQTILHSHKTREQRMNERVEHFIDGMIDW